MASAKDENENDGQLGCNLEKEVATDADTYATGCEISRSRLIALLVSRGVATKRLGRLRGRIRGSSVRLGNVRVVTRMKDLEIRKEFVEQCGEEGLSVDDGVAMLIREELVEYWLAREIGKSGKVQNHS